MSMGKKEKRNGKREKDELLSSWLESDKSGG